MRFLSEGYKNVKKRSREYRNTACSLSPKYTLKGPSQHGAKTWNYLVKD